MITTPQYALVIGAGSIGERHVSILASLGIETASVTSRTDLHSRVFKTVENAVKEWVPDYVVIANETALHQQTTDELRSAGYRGLLLIEKPIGYMPESDEDEYFTRVGVGYNLRFHPVLGRLRKLLTGIEVYTVEAYAGQALETWRPSRSLASQYSGTRARGGGVLRDLAHELDYLRWLFGECDGVFALGGRLTNVTTDSDDAWGIIARYKRAPIVTVQLNYLDTATRRRLVVNTARGTIEADLIASTVSLNGEVESFEVDRDSSYAGMHRAMLEGNDDRLASLVDGAAVEKVIAMVEQSAQTLAWVSRS